MREPFLETRRLQLHLLDVSFAEQIIAYYQKNKKHFAKGMPRMTKKMLGLPFQELLLSQQAGLMEEDKLLKLYLFEKSDQSLKNIIGDLALNNIVWGSFKSAYLGYKLDKDYLKQGYMFEGLKAAIDYGFREMKLHRIEANIRPINEDSIRLIEKLGFQKEGFSPKYLKINGKWEDHFRFALLNELIKI